MNEQITAYVLNELPPDERAAIEAQLKSDPSLRQQVEEMQSFCNLVDTHIAKSTAPSTFTEKQREQLVDTFTTSDKKVVRPKFLRHPFLLSSTALAACLAILLIRHGTFESPVADPAYPIRLEDAQIREATGSPHQEKSQPPATIDGKKSAGMAKQKVDAADTTRSSATPPPASSRNPAPNEIRPMDKSSRNRHADALTYEAVDRSTTALPAPAAKPSEPPLVTSTESSSQATLSANRRLAEMNSNADTNANANFARQEMDAAAGLMGRGAPALTASPAPTSAPHAGPYDRAVLPPNVASPAPETESIREQRRIMPPLLVGDSDGFAIVKPEPMGERYQSISENPFQSANQTPLSTFSVHTDGASYANVRRFLNDNQRPPANAVRIEELINYFPYNYEPPAGEHPFAVSVDIAEAPWQPLHRLARIGIKGLEVHADRKDANLVFLIDVSGSMNQPNKLPLVKQSLQMLTEQLRDTDRVAIVTYAGNSQIVLENTAAIEKSKILNTIQSLNAGGSTNGSGGIRSAYEQARAHFIKDGINRVILCSDGDFNVGMSSPAELESLIAQEAKSKIFLSVLGFGTGNLNDHTMEILATKGNGNHAYIDSLSEARKVLVDQLDGTLMTIAKDVKIQVEFNPAQVASYRLIGYENRTLAKEDFNNDKKDAGEIGAGHTVTALYEIVPANLKHPNGQPLVDDLKYAPSKSAQPVAAATPAPPAPSPETMTVKLRYKQPDGEVSKLIEIPVTDKNDKLETAPQDFQFAASVAGFGMLLRQSAHAPELTWDQVRQLALKGKGPDPLGYRGEFLQLIDKARSLSQPR
jgi:secreted protein with Ig-like and vWFA domain